MRTNEIAGCLHQPFDTLHRIFAQPERGFEHKPHKQEKDGQADVFVCYDGIQYAGRIVNVGLLGKRFFKCSFDEAVAGIGKSRLGIFAQQFLDVCPLLVATGTNFIALRQSVNHFLYLFIAFEEFDAEVSQREMQMRDIHIGKFTLHKFNGSFEHSSVWDSGRFFFIFAFVFFYCLVK